ncbi:major facilitator superfamily domain-containing protein [Crepidotus variabilis]|uniref:Major facilitator superfamily domain-containing protein n=1 Tax=Crepidotus variabilis TaxID=179855 RepID=A0A9P6ENC3_9AGAR|nr:major facilitator superfamily domain-containing protein [Crepidotus variabilis]
MPTQHSEDEIRPLLREDAIQARLTTERDQSEPDVEGARKLKTAPTPIPRTQLGILCLLRIVDPLSFNQIFPYINEFVSDLYVTDDPSQVGFYSGLVESAFALTQLLSIYLWSYTSDHLGRRPVVLAGLAGLATTTLLFGLSKSFATVMLTRALGGIASGNVPVIPSMLIEITDESNQAVAFAFFGMWWPIGTIAGPLIGGLLSKPAARFPKYLDYQFLRDNPYFLPCLMVASFTLFSFVVASFMLEETMESKKTGKKLNVQSNSSMIAQENAVATRYTAKELLGFPVIRALCFSGFALSFLSTAFDVLFVLFCYSPVLLGGLAFSPSEIGFALSTSGFLAALLQVFFMPMVLNRVDHAKLYHFSMKLWPYVFLSLPLLNVIARLGLDEETGRLTPRTVQVLWVSIALMLSVFRLAVIAYSVNMLLVKKYVPSPASLGSTIGLIQFSICAARAIAPAVASSIFAFSASTGLLGGYLWVPVLTTFAFMGSLFSKNIVKETSRI